MRRTEYILEYRYDHYESDDWQEEAVFDDVADAHMAFTDHVREYTHTIARVRKVRYVQETNVIARFEPISSEEYSNE